MKKVIFGGFWMLTGVLMTYIMEDAPLIYSGGFFGFLIDLLVIAGYGMLFFGAFMTIKGLREKDQ